MEPIRPGLTAICNTDNETIRKNIRMSRRYPRIELSVAKYLPAAVVGGGPSAKTNIEILKTWHERGGSDIFAINDTARFLSDNGIQCYIFSADCTEIPFKIGSLVKGAIFASRVNRKQFLKFKRKEVRVFHMLEDVERFFDPNLVPGFEGGGTSVCRTPLLLTRIGYQGVYYFGCEGSFYDFSHVTGKSDAISWNMMVIKAGDIEYLTNAAFVLQSKYLAEKIRKHPGLFVNVSSGLLKAMIENYDTWEVAAIGEDLRKQYTEKKSEIIWDKEYDIREHKIWRPEVSNANTN